ncbi:hypothetical protein PCYB_092900 [Plasmodium cynomolgi strain B]|uniref:SANT domain-containing protein n=1 Tax=Plasmodium cynomolgi (strain B) TaxID=1120755 RepID=K6UW21_PLACD|nr:hypothetical protein PCYB_092900 [Plasmodium cynomolgi strain B]GAB66505.1 hypothetical protein PCYB_092900 [Plasmodium cynomolgi strain B]
MKESKKSKESGGARASKKKTYKQKQVKYMILKKLKRKMKQGLHKLEQQHEHLGKLLSNLNSLKIEESNVLALHKMTKELTRQIKRVSEENNDDIAILKMEKDLIKANFTKNKNSLKIYKDELQLRREVEGEEEEDGGGEEEEGGGGGGEEEEGEEEEHHQQHKQQGQNDYEEGVVEQEEVSRIIRHDKRKKKKRKSTNANSSHHFTNSFIPLQIFRDNCLCMNNKCHHNEFSSDHLQVKNWVLVDLYKALLRNKYYKNTHLCGKVLGEHDNNEIYRQEMRRMRKKKLLLNFLSCRRKSRKAGPPRGPQLEESDLGAQTIGGSYPSVGDGQDEERDQISGPLGRGPLGKGPLGKGALGRGPLGRGTPTSCSHQKKAPPDHTPLCSLSNPINDQRNRNICWINMKNEINEEVSKNNTSIMTVNILTFLVSISKVFSCELIEERRDKSVTNDFIVNKKSNKFYDYLPTQQYDLMSIHHAAGTCHRSSAPAMNTHEMRNAHQSYQVRDNHICLYLKREYVPPYLLNLGKKIKLILNFVSEGGLRGGFACHEGGEEPTGEPLTGVSPPAADRSARLEHDGGLMQRYRSLFLKKKKRKGKKSGKEKKSESTGGSGGNGSGGNGGGGNGSECGNGSGTCTVRAFDDNHRFNNTLLSALMRQNLSEKKKYHYFYVNNVEYDHMGYDVEDIITHLEKVVNKWERNSCGGVAFSPLSLLNYEEKYLDEVHQGQGEIEEECSKGGKAVGMKGASPSEKAKGYWKEDPAEQKKSVPPSYLGKKMKNMAKGASQMRKSKAMAKGKVKDESEKKQYQEPKCPVDEEFIPNGLKGAATTVGDDMETYYLTIHNDMLSYSSSNDEVTVKYYVTHMHNREFNLEEGNQDMQRNIHPTFFYYVQRKKQLEKMMKEHSALYKHIFKMWKEDIEIGEKERERKNIFAWGILPVRAYDHPNIFVPLPYGFKHNNKNLAYSSLRLKRPFADEEEEEEEGDDDIDDGGGYGGDENGNVMEKRGKEKKKDYMNIKYANLTGPCITWRKNCISFNYSKKKRNSHLVEAFPYLYCMQGPKMPLFSLERNVLYCNENNRSVVPDGPVPCKEGHSNPVTSKEAQSNPVTSKEAQSNPFTSKEAQSNPFTCKDAENEKNFIWDKQEIKTFLEKYFLYPKNFEKISQYLEFKSTKQCVDFYYLTKNFFNFKNFLLTISLNRVKRNKKHRSVGSNDTTKKNSKEEIVAQLMEKLERNYDPSEFEQSNFFHLNFINIRHFFQNYFAKTFSDVQSTTGGGLSSSAAAGAAGAAGAAVAASAAAAGGSLDPARTTSTSPPLSRSVTTAQNIDGGTDGAVTQRSKTIVLENMSDGYVVPKNYKFILSANKKLCFLVKNEENFIYSGINSDIIEIVYNDNMDGDKKKRKNERSEKDEGGEKKKKMESIEKMDKLDRVPFMSQNPTQLTHYKVALVYNQQPSTATCSSMITTPPPSNGNEVSEKAVGEEGSSNLGKNDLPRKKVFNASPTGEFFPPVDEEKASHWQILQANAMGKLKKEKRDNQEMCDQLLNFNSEEKTHHQKKSDVKNLQNGELTRVAGICGSVKERRDKMAFAYNCNMNYNRGDYNPFGENGQLVNLRRSSASSSKRGEEEKEEEEAEVEGDDEEMGSLVQLSEMGSLVELSEMGSLAQLSEVKTHDIHNVDSRSSSVLGLYPQPSNDDDAVRRASYPDSNDSVNNPFENNVKIETSEESLYKCFEFLKNLNWRDTRNVEAVSSKNSVQVEPMEIGRYSTAPVTPECKMKKVSRKNSIQSNEGVCLQKEKNVKRKEIIPAGKSKGGGGKDNTLVRGEIGQWEEGGVSAVAGVGPSAVEEGSTTGHTIHGRNKDERNHSGKKGKTAVNQTWVNATTKRRLSNVLSWNGMAEGAVGGAAGVAGVAGSGSGSGARAAADLKRDFTVKPEYEKALKRKKTSNAQMSEEGPVMQARWDKWATNGSEEVLSDDRTNSMMESQLREEAMMQVCDLNLSEGIMSQARASQEHQSYDILINSQSLDTQNSWVPDSNESGGLLMGRSHIADRDGMKQNRSCSGDNINMTHFNMTRFNNRSSAIPLQGEDRWNDMKWNGGSSSVASCKKRKTSDNTGGGNDEEEAVAAELAGRQSWGRQPWEKQPVENLFTQVLIRENPQERSDIEHRRNSIQSSKSSNQCSMDSLQQMESYEGGCYDDPSKQPFRKTATKWTDREKEIYFEVFEKEGKNWDTLLLALHPYGKTREQIKNFYQNTIVKRRKSEAP